MEHGKLDLGQLDFNFKQSASPEVWVWRYLDLPKFVSMLETSRLYLSRADLLGDPYEGSLTRLDKVRQADQGKIRGYEEYDGAVASFRKELRQLIFISCWHTNEDESEAMWRLYCGESYGVAIKTTYRKLQEFCAANELWIGLVEYRDYKAESFSASNALIPFMTKRRSFSHERETRILKLRRESSERVSSDGVIAVPGIVSSAVPPGLTVQWDIESIADAICVHPYAPNWYFETVRKLVARYSLALSLVVERSVIVDEPLF